MKKIKKIRVALFTDVLKENLDGVTYTLYNLIERIPKDRFEFLFITPFPPSENVTLPYPVIVCRYIKMPLQEGYRLALPYFDGNLRRALDEFKPDLVHFTTPSFLGRYARQYALKKRLPLVSTYHTHFPNYVDYYFKYLPFLRFLGALVPPILRFFYNECSVVYVPTKPVLEDLVKIGIERKRLTIWGRGIDTAKFNPRKRDEKFIGNLCGKNTVRILFVSRLYWVKEIMTVIGIYKVLSRIHPNVKAVDAVFSVGMLGYIQDVTLVPDYEKKFVMDQAMAGSQEYFDQFYTDMENRRFAMIVSDPLFTKIKDSDYIFSEENNAWVQWVAEPLLCYYAPVRKIPNRVLEEFNIQLLVPRDNPQGCP